MVITSLGRHQQGFASLMQLLHGPAVVEQMPREQGGLTATMELHALNHTLRQPIGMIGGVNGF
jgi:hypothetical protein